MHQQNLAGRDGFCIEREKALLRQKALCEQRWQNADGQRFESGPGHKHVTKRGKLSHGQVLHICQRRNCRHYVRLLCAEHLDRLMCGAALHLKRHIGMHLPELSQLRQQEMVQRRLRSADDRRTCFKSGQPLQLAFAVGRRFESAVHMGKSAVPSTVSRTPRETRVNNLQPRDSSSRWMERVTAGWDRHSSLGGLCDIAGLCHRIKGAVIFQIEGFHGQLPCERKENMLTRDHALLFHLLLGIALFAYMQYN